MSKLTNFKEETLEFMNKLGKTSEDVLFVRTLTTQCSFAEFLDIIDGFEYNCGFGSEKINPALVIVGEDWWLERGTYDGSEWWEFKEKPKPIAENKPLKFNECYEYYLNSSDEE